MHSISYFLLCVWAACIFCAFVGYGNALLLLLRIRNMPWSLAGLLGISLVVAFGGVLNLMTALVRPILLGLVFLGDLLLLLSTLQRPVDLTTSFRSLIADRKTILLGILVVSLLAIPVLRNVRTTPLSFGHDDWDAYLTIPVQTSQLGTLPADPFDERRIASGLGAAYFLQTFNLVFGDVRTLRFMDSGIGFLFYAAVAYGIFRTLHLAASVSLSLVLLIFLVPLERLNLTMVVLPAALFEGLFLIQIHPALGKRPSLQRSILLGLVGGALSCLKSNYLPPALLICGCYYVATFLCSRNKIRVFVSAMVSVLITCCILLPWMFDMKQKEATFLFPIFGRGYDASAYGAIPAPGGIAMFGGIHSVSVLLSVLALAGPVLFAAGAVFVAYKRHIEPEWAPIFAFLLAAGLAVFAIAAATAGASIGRFTLPFLVPALLIFAAFILRWGAAPSRSMLWLKIAGSGAIAGLLVFALLSGVRGGEYFKFLWESGLVSPRIPYIPLNISQEQKRLRALQSAVPRHQPILAHLFVSFALDFKRNQIFIADYMGMAGLPPGMPVGKGADALRSYLLTNYIRYIAYGPSRVGEPDSFPGVPLQAIIANPAAFGRESWVTIQAKVTEDEQNNIAGLAKRYKHIYDDGESYVLDLKAPH